MNLEAVRTAVSLLEHGEPFAWVTIVDNLGSSPRHVGAAMLVRTDGSIAGTVGGGALEGAAIRTALETVRAGGSTLMDYNLTNKDSAKLGMICGGTGTLLIDYISPENSGAREYFAALLSLLGRAGKGWTISMVPQDRESQWVSRTCLLDFEGNTHGASACSADVLQRFLAGDRTAIKHAQDDTKSFYMQPIGLQGAAYIFGAGHCGEKLARVLSMVDFHVTVVDDRGEFANAGRFPAADRILVPDSFDNVMDSLDIDEDSYLVIVTRGHMFDRTVLAQSLRTPAGYVGMIGSRKKIGETFRALTEAAFAQEDIARVHAPIGLSIGAETPEEIAISIAAQMIQVRAGKRS